MANPQKENGFVPIANEIYSALCSFRIPGEVRQVFDAIIRKTYGYNKSEDKIANTQIIELTGLKKGNVSRGLSSLITHKLVIKTDNFSKDGKTLGINKDYEQWIPFVIRSDNKKKLSKRKPKLSKPITEVIRSDNKKLSEVRDTIDNIHSKDTLQKTERTPAILTKTFFKGVQDLRESAKEKEPVTSEEGKTTQMFLKELQAKYPDAPKDLLWTEIQKFERYWTEKNKTGKQQLWEMNKTFEVDRRLVTWFGRIKSFEPKQVIGKYQAGKVMAKPKTNEISKN